MTVASWKRSRRYRKMADTEGRRAIVRIQNAATPSFVNKDLWDLLAEESARMAWRMAILAIEAEARGE